MKLNTQELRKQIREVILNSDGLQDISIIKKADFEEIKKDVYNNIIDIKNELESEKIIKDKEGSIAKINSLVVSLKKLRQNLEGML